MPFFAYAHSVLDRQPFKLFGKKLKEAREGGNHTSISLAQFSTEESGRWGLESFSFGHSSVSRWESGQFLPSLARFVALLRGCKRPASFFLRSLGLSDEEICDCSKMIPSNEDEKKLVEKLLQAWRNCKTDVDKELLERTIKMVYEESLSEFGES